MESSEVEAKPVKAFFRGVLWTAVGAFSLAALATIVMILLTDFNDKAQAEMFGRVCFILWQTIWFGGISLLFADRYEKSTLGTARGVAVAGVGLAVVALIIGVGQALKMFALSDMGEDLKTVVSIFLYSAVFAELILLMEGQITTVKVLRNIMVALIGVFDVIVAMLVLSGVADASDILVRLVIVFVILMVVGFIITAILQSLHRQQHPEMYPQNNMMGGNMATGGAQIPPTFVPVTPAKPLNGEGEKGDEAQAEGGKQDTAEGASK